jgi:hypothetical protein
MTSAGRARGGRLLRLFEREPIGQPECPLFYRWTLWNRWGVKVMVHHFMPELEDPDTHDHPSSFVTFVLRGTYYDRALCGCQRESEADWGSLAEVYRQNGLTCPDCHGRGVILETMRAPKAQFRHAAHAHGTVTGPTGAWTVVVMGPKIRPWGFWRQGRWFDYWTYEQEYGFQRICDV